MSTIPTPIPTTPQILEMMIDQNRLTSEYSFRKVDPSNQALRLNPEAASVGFMLRHSGEIMHILAKFLGQNTSVENTTMGFEDTGQGVDTTASMHLVTTGYELLKEIVTTRESAWWIEKVRAPIFGTVERFKVLAHILNHNAHHAGQIALTLSKGTSAA